MDKFSKISIGYIASPVIIIAAFIGVSMISTDLMFYIQSSPELFVALPLIAHLIYLKFFVDEVIKKDKSRIWLPFVGLTGIFGAIAYLISR